MIVLIDNFDSFTYNLQDYLQRDGHVVKTIRYDSLELESLKSEIVDGLVISPGPGVPNDYPKHFELFDTYLGKVPILGVCLGHQSLGCYFGATLTRAIKPMHGKVSEISHIGADIFSSIKSPTAVTRYHSLIIEKLPLCLKPLAYTTEDELMAFKHEKHKVSAVQFHPEAYLTTFGVQMIGNWLKEVKKTK